jgi:hypothetical protein
MFYGIFVVFLVLFLLGRLIVWYCWRYLPPGILRIVKTSAQTDLRFPGGFSFGSATAAWQIEWDVQPSNWTLFEHRTKGDGKTPCCPQHLNACDAIA